MNDFIKISINEELRQLQGKRITHLLQNPNQFTNRQLTKWKAVSNAFIKNVKPPFTQRKAAELFERCWIVKTVDKIQHIRHKDAIKKFYTIDPALRPKKHNVFLSEYFDIVYGPHA